MQKVNLYVLRLVCCIAELVSSRNTALGSLCRGIMSTCQKHQSDSYSLRQVSEPLVWLLLQVIDRILYKLDELVRPFVHKILVVIEPLLIDEDYYARVEGREIIANLSKAAGLATMIAAMRPDIDNIDE